MSCSGNLVLKPSAISDGSNTASGADEIALTPLIIWLIAFLMRITSSRDMLEEPLTPPVPIDPSMLTPAPATCLNSCKQTSPVE